MKILYMTFVILLVMISNVFYANAASPLKLIQKISLPHVKGRIDHMAIDIKGMRLFVAALGNNTIEVIDLKSGKQIRTISGLSEPQGILYVPDGNKIYVANGGNGECDIFDGDSFKVTKKIKFSGDADNLRYNTVTGKVYVGYGNGGIGVISSLNDQLIGDVKLSGHPEAFAIEANNDRIYVNIPAIKAVAVVNCKELKIESVLPLNGTSGNFPMALDSVNHRLFVGCRNPNRLLIFDTRSKKLMHELEIDGDTDDLFYDSVHKGVCVSCGQGFIDVIREINSSAFGILERIPTAAGARTSLFVSQFASLYLAVPAKGAQPTEIWVYHAEF